MSATTAIATSITTGPRPASARDRRTRHPDRTSSRVLPVGGWLRSRAEFGANRELQARVARAVSQAATNLVHAYPDAGPRPLHVAADFEAGDLEVIVADRGDGLRVRRSPGLGAGLGIIAETCGEFVVREREGAGVELWMRFHING